MRYLRWIGRLVLFVVLLGFAIKNTDPVSVHYFLGWEWRAPLALVLLVVLRGRCCPGRPGRRGLAVSPSTRGGSAAPRAATAADDTRAGAGRRAGAPLAVKR